MKMAWGSSTTRCITKKTLPIPPSDLSTANFYIFLTKRIIKVYQILMCVCTIYIYIYISKMTFFMNNIVESILHNVSKPQMSIFIKNDVHTTYQIPT